MLFECHLQICELRTPLLRGKIPFQMSGMQCHRLQHGRGFSEVCMFTSLVPSWFKRLPEKTCYSYRKTEYWSTVNSSVAFDKSWSPSEALKHCGTLNGDGGCLDGCWEVSIFGIEVKGWMPGHASSPSSPKPRQKTNESEGFDFQDRILKPDCAQDA